MDKQQKVVRHVRKRHWHFLKKSRRGGQTAPTALPAALVTVRFSFDDKPTVNSQDELAVATSGSHNLRRRSNGECNHEMPGLPYPTFRRVNAGPGGGKPSPYGERAWRTSVSRTSRLVPI